MRAVVLGTALVVWGVTASPTAAAIPHLIRYQGQAVDSQGVPLQGPYNLTFRLYGVATGGTPVWEEPQTGVLLAQGHFSVLLGQGTPFGSLDWSQPLWLGVQVNADPELAPRQQITSVPLAIRSEVAEKLSVPVTTSTISDDASRLVPSGAIILWNGPSCPAGYTRVSTMDGKFLVSGSVHNQAAGGSNTHTHGAGSYVTPSHTHTVSKGPWAYSDPDLPLGVLNAGQLQVQLNQDMVTSSGGGGSLSGTSGSADSRPEFATVLLCQKD